MALTITNKVDSVFGNKRFLRCDIAFDSSYPTGGESLTAANLGMQALDLVLVAPSGGLLFEFDHTNSKVKAWFPTGGATAAPTSNANPIVTTGGASATAVDATTPNITPGKGKEVGATADLSAITTRIIALGS